MKELKSIVGGVLAAVLIVLGQIAHADGTNSVAAGKPTPYPLDYCVVSGEKFGGDMGPPVVFIYQTNGINQEIKFCCPMCKPEFLKDPDKYMKIIKAAETNAPAAQK